MIIDMLQKKVTKWRADFRIEPPLRFREVKNLANIKIIKEGDDPDDKAARLEVTIDQPTEELAINSAKQIANRCADYLTFLKGFPVEITLLSITEPSGLKPATQLIYPTLIKDRLDANRDVDFNAKPIPNILDGNEFKLCIELYHYHEALKSDDIAVKIEELFQILEHEYDKNDPSIEKYKHLRDAVLHPKPNNSDVRQFLNDKLGRDYITSREDLTKFMQEVHEMRGKVEERLSALLT